MEALLYLIFLFADDCILFGEANRSGASTLKNILTEYENYSRQYVNFDKSSIFYSFNTLSSDRKGVENILGIRSSAKLRSIWG